jgi:2-iminobutanoate/2-iminopropanoate deaminase
MTRQVVNSPQAPKPIGPYSHASTAPGLGVLFLSGQTPVDPSSGELVDGGATEQTRQAFRNLGKVLSQAGLNWSCVIKVNVYLVSMEDFADMNAVYGEVFDRPYPARTTVAVAELPLKARVEIEVVAAYERNSLG